MGDELEPDYVGSRDTLYRRPRPWGHYVVPSLVGLFLLLFGLIGEWLVSDPRTPMTMNGREIQPPTTWDVRWPFLVFLGIPVVLGPIVPLLFAITSDLVIREQGIQVNDSRISLSRPTGVWINQSISVPMPTSFGQFCAEIRKLFASIPSEMFPIIPWEHVKSCRWSRFEFNRNTLWIIGVNGNHLEYRIPAADRAEVEAIFRRFGKWEV